MKLLYMASMARSGETLMQKILVEHEKISALSQIDRYDKKINKFVYEHIRENELDMIDANFLSKLNLKETAEYLLVKQGTWEKPDIKYGFILSRNPVSIYSSLKNYSTVSKNKDYWLNLSRAIRRKRNSFLNNRYRLKHWLDEIDPDLSLCSSDLSIIELFCTFYNRRMGALYQTGMPIVRYEDFVKEPLASISGLLTSLEIEPDSNIVEAHNRYNGSVSGHGMNDLSRAIDSTSLLKYQKNIGSKEFSIIKALTYPVHGLFNYKMDWGTDFSHG